MVANEACALDEHNFSLKLTLSMKVLFKEKFRYSALS